MKWIEQWDGFEWDEGNSTKNWKKHHVAALECEEAFTDEPIIVTDDIKHSKAESRRSILGQTKSGRRLFVSFTIRGKKIRVISARPMSKKEQTLYEEIKEDTEV
jgi:uncharacterized DUF497 family protein